MTPVVLAYAALGWSFGQLLVGIVLAIACCALVMVVVKYCGIAIPEPLMKVVCIVVVAVVVIAAIKFLLAF